MPRSTSSRQRNAAKPGKLNVVNNRKKPGGNNNYLNFVNKSRTNNDIELQPEIESKLP